MPQRTIVDAWMETHNVRTLRFDYRETPATFHPGQFIVVADAFRGYAKPVRRAYSIASSALQRDFVDITVKREVPGLMSMRLTEAPVGTTMEVADPAGKYHWDPSKGKRILLLGAGSGVTPLHSIALTALEGGESNIEVFLYYSVRSPADLIYERRWPEISAKHPNFHFHVTMTRASKDEWKGRHGRITPEWIAETSGDVSDCVSFICGPGPMVEAMEEVCRAAGLTDERINTEKW